MKIFKVYLKEKNELIGYCGCYHYGYDPEIKKIGVHSIYISKDNFFENSLNELRELNKQHKFCFKIPIKPKIRKDLYEIRI